MKQQLCICNDEALILDATPFIESASFATNEHGIEHISFTARRNAGDNVRLFARDQLFEVGLHEGPIAHARARLESPGLKIGQENSYSAKALGYWRAFDDLPYTAMWNMTDCSKFIPINTSQGSNRRPERFQFDTNGRVYIAPRKGEAFSVDAFGSINYSVPNRSRQILGVSFDYKVKLPVGWAAGATVHDEWFVNYSTAWGKVGTGALETGSAWATTVSRDALYFEIYHNVGTPTVYGGETGDAFLEITNLRIVTSTTNSIQTTLGSSAVAGSNVNLLVGSTAGMYVGQELLIGATVSAMERVRVTVINSSTSVTIATLAANKPNAALVRAHKITPDQIIRDCATIVATTNASQLSANLSLIQTATRDLSDTVVFEDTSMAEILTDLAAKGNGAQAYEVGVDTEKHCYFRPRWSAARRWFVSVSELELERTIDGLYNGAYGIYKGSRNEPLRTANASDSTSVARYGLTRRQAVTSDSTSAIIADQERDSAIANSKSVVPRAQFPIERIFSEAGLPANISEVKAGDIFILQNLPVTGELNAVAELHLTRTEVDLVAGILTVEPELPLPTIDVQLAAG